jgi:tripartite-type tricarboxylate transporter receptor subunit TctC
VATHRGRRWWGGLALACVLVAPAVAQPAGEWPSRPIRVVVPYAVGGPSDVLVRIVAPKLAERLGQPIVVDNRVGASGNIGTDFVAKSAPDGYTLVIGTNTTAANATLFRNLSFDIVRDFAPITTLFRDGNMLVVEPSFAGRSVADLVAMARAKPGALSYASSGNGTSTHLAGVLLTQATKTDITHVPYKGIAAGVTDVMGGQATMMFASIAIVSPQIKGGRLRALAVTRDTRLEAFPDVPTMAEAGFPGFELTNGWGGFWAPAGTPRAIVERLQREVAAVLRTPEIREAFANRNVEPGGEAPDAFARAIATDIQKLAVIVRASGATLD